MSEEPVITADAAVEAATPQPPEPAAEAGASKPTPKKWWHVWRKAEPKEKPPKRALLVRLFGVGIWGWIKLILLCVLVGFVMLAMQFDPASEEFGARQAFLVFLENAIATARWAFQNSWKPALIGAGVVLPIWVLWRLMTLPFRR